LLQPVIGMRPHRQDGAAPVDTEMNTQREVLVYQDGQEWLREACSLLLRVSQETVQSRDRVFLTLSGGSTPQAFYRALASPPWQKQFNWSRIVFLFGDERCVAPDHPDSNYGMARRTLFEPLGIASEQIHRMKGELDDPASAAQDYEQTLRRLTDCPVPAVPDLDVVLLGLGEDGHIASLFPGSSALSDRTNLVTVGRSPKEIALRLTLTLGVINRATVVLFLVTGKGKGPVVRAVLEPRDDHERGLPAALVQPERGRVIWLLDQSAGAALSRTPTGTT
jgi:6-phosphogluconolactonase